MKNKDFYKVAKKHFPNLSEDEIWYVIWNETGYPGFFHNNPKEEFEKQLKEFQAKHGK